MKIKKILSLILAVFILLWAVIPTTNAAKWHVSSIDKTYFEIPPDDRNLRDFVFGNQVINYKKWSDNSDSWSSMEATIAANMIWYKTIFNNNPTEWLKVVTNEDISTFFVVVDNSFYKSDWTFAFPIYKRWFGIEYMYMYWKSDEDQNYCLYFDLQNQWTEVYKIKHTCHMQLYDRDPFLLFFQVWRTWYDIPTYQWQNDTSWHMNSEENMPTYKISVTTTHKAKYKEKDYITFNVPEVFHLEVPEFDDYGFWTSNPNSFMNDANFKLVDGKYLSNTLKSEPFLRQGNQRAFRPYSFYFEKDLLKRYDEINADETLKAKHCTNSYCQITSPFDYTSFFESFVLSVAAQYYNSPAVTNDNTYIEAPDWIEWGWFHPYNECSWFLDVWCHISNVWISISNGFKMFLNWFADIIKSIFLWIFESIKNFPPIKWLIDTFQPMLVILWDYFMSYFTPIWDIFTGKTNLQNIAWGNQEYICSKEPSNFIMESTTPAGKKPMEALWAFIYFINPLPPLEWAEICTNLWMKRIEYGKNTILDVFLFNIFVFAGIWFAFIWLRRYN